MEKTRFVVGNWKSNKTIADTQAWWTSFLALWKQYASQITSVKVILCPTFIHLDYFHTQIRAEKIPLWLGAQDVSQFETGAYTGQVSAQMLSGLVSHVIIGHSERRKFFHETDTELQEKVTLAKNAHLEPIYCVSDVQQLVPQSCSFIAYEPLFAIGTGTADTPENAQKTTTELVKKAPSQAKILYGGSVSADNVAAFLQIESISGVLVGGASLDPKKFMDIINAARA